MIEIGIYSRIFRVHIASKSRRDGRLRRTVMQDQASPKDRAVVH